MKPVSYQKDTNAWVLQVWASFIISIVASVTSILYLPVDNALKSSLGVSFVFALSSSFTLAKTIRDNQEASRLTSKIEEAKVEKILAEHLPMHHLK